MIDRDNNSSSKERKLLTDNGGKDAEKTPEQVLEQNIFSSLCERFLGEHVRDSTYAHEAFALRKSVGEALANPPIDKDILVQKIKASEGMEKRQQIIETKLDKHDLINIAALDTLLTENPKLLTALRNGILEFQFKRLDELQIEPDQIKQNIDHIQRVVEYADYPGRAASKHGQIEPTVPRGLSVLGAAVHDIDKVANHAFITKNEEARKGTITLLAEHEYMSAIVGSQVVEEALKAAGLEQYAASAAKLIGKAVLSHGEGEWPERQAKAGKLPATMSLDANDELYLLLGGVYPRSPSSSEMPIVDDEISTNDSEELRDAEAICRATIEAVSTADKMDGLGDLSLVKYHQGNSIQYIFSRSTSHEYAKTFAETLVFNMRNAPDVAAIKQNPNVQGVVNRAGLLYSILEAVESHPALTELNIAAGHEVPDFLPPYSDALGSDTAKSLIITAIEMRDMFKVAKDGWDKDGVSAKHMSDDELQSIKYIRRELRAIKAKKEYALRLEKLISDIQAIPSTLLTDNKLGDTINAMITELHEQFV